MLISRKTVLKLTNEEEEEQHLQRPPPHVILNTKRKFPSLVVGGIFIGHHLVSSCPKNIFHRRRWEVEGGIDVDQRGRLR